MRKSPVVVLAAPVAWAMMMGGVAFGATIAEGLDYSYSTSSNRKAVICDKEADARTAYVQYEAGDLKQGRINDQDGSSGYCWQNTNDVPSSIRFHKTCEDINNWPDACSKWDQHF